MNDQTLVKQAQEGKPEALADFVVTELNLEDIKVEILADDNCLRVVLEAERIREYCGWACLNQRNLLS